MDRVFKTLVIPMPLASLMHTMAAADQEAAMAFGWSAECFNAAKIPTHQVFSGQITAAALARFECPEAMQAGAATVGVDLTSEQAQALHTQIVVSDDDAAPVLADMGLSLQGSETEPA